MPEKFFQPGPGGFTSGYAAGSVLGRSPRRLSKGPVPKSWIGKSPKFLEGFSRRGVLGTGLAAGAVIGGGLGYSAGYHRPKSPHRLRLELAGYRTGDEDRLSAKQLSAKLDDLIQFRAGFISPGNIEKVFGGGMRSRFAGLASRGASPVVARPRVMGGLVSGHDPTVENMFKKFIASRSAANPAIRAPVEGAVKSAATGGYGAVNPFSGIRSLLPQAGSVAKPASARLAAASPSAAQVLAEKAGQAVGAAKEKVSAVAKYGATAGLVGGGGLAAGALLASGRKQEEEQFSIKFAIPPKAYPEAVMKTVWNKIKKPSRKTFGQIMRRHDPRSPIPTMVFRNQAHMLSAKLDELISFAADPRPRNPLGEFSPQNSGGPDPNAMATVYKMPQLQPQQQGGLPGSAATLLAGGALGAVGASAGKQGYEQIVKGVKHLAAKRKSLRLR
jgi:hypothetical protein